MRNLFLVLFFFLCIVVAPIDGLAQEPGQILTLEQATAAALAANRVARIGDLDQERARDDVKALKIERLPKLDLKVFEGGFLSPVAFSFTQGAFGTFPATGPIPFEDLTVDSPRNLGTVVLFTAIQPLTQLRRISTGEKLLKLGQDLAAEKSRASRLTIAADVKRGYYGLLQVGAGLVAAREALTQLDELDRVVREYVEREVALPADHLAVRTERARADQTILSLRHLEATLKERINLLMGRDLAAPFTVTPAFPPATETIDLAAAVQRARTERPAIREAALNVQRAMEDARLTERKRVPDIGVAFSFARLFNVEVIPETIAAAGVLVSWEPFDWGRRRIERDGKSRTIEQARLAQHEAEAMVTLDVNVKHRKVQETESALAVAELARQTASERLRVATDRYRVEAALLKDVLEAQTALARATQEYQQALGAYWTARADLDEAVGQQP